MKHPWIEKSHLRWFVSDFVIKRVLWILTGTTVGVLSHLSVYNPDN